MKEPPDMNWVKRVLACDCAEHEQRVCDKCQILGSIVALQARVERLEGALRPITEQWETYEIRRKDGKPMDLPELMNLGKMMLDGPLAALADSEAGTPTQSAPCFYCANTHNFGIDCDCVCHNRTPKGVPMPSDIMERAREFLNERNLVQHWHSQPCEGCEGHITALAAEFDAVRAEALGRACDAIDKRWKASRRIDVDGSFKRSGEIFKEAIRALTPDGWLAEHDRTVRLEEARTLPDHTRDCVRGMIKPDCPRCKRIDALSTPAPKEKKQ